MKLNKHKLISLIEHFQEIKEIQEKKLVLVTETMKKIESDLEEAQAYLDELYQLLNPDKINENRIFQKIEAAK